MNHHLLRQLTPTGQNQTLKLRIARLWETIIPTTKKFIGLDFIAVDSEGNAIHASIKREDVDFYRPLLKEGSLYQIFRFQVSGLKNSHNAVQKQHMIYLSKTSIVNELYEDMTAYPRYHFQFLTREQMAVNANSDKYMIDVIGVLDSIGPIIQVQKRNRQMTDIRNIFIKELSGDILKVTVWNEFIPEIKEDELLNQKPKPILIFAGVIAKSFMGQISVSTSSGTAIYINLDIPETLLLRERYQDDQTYAQLLPLEDEEKARNNNPENNKKITIEDLLQFNPKNIQKIRYTCEAKIKNWNKHSGWFYKACNQCYQTLQGWADAFWCTQHGEKTPMLVLSAHLSMRLNLMIEDDTGEMEIGIFGSPAEFLTGISMVNMPAIEDMDKREPPKKISDIIGNKYTFTVGLTNEAVKCGFLAYKIFGSVLLEAKQNSPTASSSQILLSLPPIGEPTSVKQLEVHPTVSENLLEPPNSQEADQQLATQSPAMTQIPSDLFPEESPAKRPKCMTKLPFNE